MLGTCLGDLVVKSRISFHIACGAMLLASAFRPADALAQHSAAARVPHGGATVSAQRSAVVAPHGAVVTGPHGGVAVATPRGGIVASGGHYHYPGYPVYGYGYPAYGSFYVGYPWYGGGFGFSVGVGFGYSAYGYPYYAYPYAYAPYPYPAAVYYDGSAAMHLQVTPRNTEVYVDGYYAGVVDQFDGTFQRLNIQPGSHDIELYLPGHRLLQRQVYLQPGKTTDIKYAMEPLAPGEPEPPKPTPGPDQSITPSQPQQQQQQQQQPPPPYSGSNRRPSASPVRDTPADNGLSVYAGDPNRSVDTHGSLSLMVQPGPATVMIDGQKWEGSPNSDRLEVQLSPGTHVLEIQKDGFHRYTTEVTVRAGQTSTLNVALSKN
jgi:hypothetical protein